MLEGMQKLQPFMEGSSDSTALLGFQIHLSYFPFVGFPLITSQSSLLQL